jgi:hypothetical protein
MVLVIAGLLVAVAVGGWLVTPESSLQVSRVRLVGPPPHEVADGAQREISDPARIRAIHGAIDLMPRVDESRYFCPISWGIRYRLDFGRPGPHFFVTAEADGCRFVRQPLGDVRQSSTAFWDLLADAMGVRPADLFPDPTRETTR